ncbi:PQQ-dependent dehydrogenase, methanol/ethanol family [Sphingomonas colocasiae]|uniref:PQQ-dependent dehydrogenase, methanol/ethanol family n=1 Tax=Sphingomonas colocasiae TaxID=1848973 RepID=A0ABS7PW90_9SPHN|nr:PQQ-dependent dehydrogenase, methanol/ethanol family [Sphingomonas colocasiae]MBY8825627.1 PQQ-dependent dehydrogenase, methanol/ethanol family [Sphingomonas colocasiae]
MRSAGLFLPAILSLALTACNGVGGAAASHDADPAGWSSRGGSPLEQHYSKAGEINRDNVGDLGLAWHLDLDTDRGQEATPFVVDGVLYATTAWSKVIAVDAATGALIWQYDPHVPGETAIKACCDVVNRGAAYSDGKIFSATLDGRLIALDAKTGKLVWSADTLDKGWPYTITGAPRVAKGKVFIGNGGGDLGARGYVSAYDAATGKRLWRFYTVPGDPAKGPDGAASDEVLRTRAAPTWAGDYWKYGGGGTVWDAIVYDPELDQLYIGVGNGSPWNHRIRSNGKGDNLFLTSIVALDPDSGEYLWHYQQNPGETWDFTATQPIILADLTIEGKARKVLMQAPKNGFFYVIDRTNGALVSAKNFVPVTWASGIDMKTGRPIETANARYEKPELGLPGSPGAHSWQPMAYSPSSGLVYIPAQSIPFLYREEKNFVYRPGRWNLGVDLAAAPPPRTPAEMKAAREALHGALIAWNPMTQSLAWKVDHPRPVNGGVLATAGGLVFQGEGGGAFVAYDDRNGTPLWRFDSQSGIVAAPMSYRIGDTQYVAVLAGYGGAMALALPDLFDPRPRMNGRLLVFKLGGKAKLPPRPDLLPFALTSEALPPAAVEKGAALYADRCSGCHSAAVLSANVTPDLRRSGVLPDRDGWRSVVLDGILAERGMVSFSASLSPDDAESIRLYVQAEARAAAGRAKGGAGGR